MIDDIDRTLFRVAQADFPVTERPFRDLGKKCGLSEADTIARLRKLRKEGLIRRIGPVWDAKSLGLVSRLMAFRVPVSRIEIAAKEISRCKGVTHNYLRKARYNLWFTLTARNPDALKKTIRSLARKVKPQGILELPALRIYKIGVKLEA